LVAVGVSGHRVLRDIEGVCDLIDAALEVIVTTHGDVTPRIISPLAEGADRLVAVRALDKLNASLVVPLPLPVSEYLRDFDTPESKAVFLRLLERAEEVIELPNAGSREQCYLAAGLYVLNHCDVLIAVWDGEPARGTGGTAEIVHEARRLGLPIAWVHTSNRDPERITYENFKQETT
jgi:hypothetical protein